MIVPSLVALLIASPGTPKPDASSNEAQKVCAERFRSWSCLAIDGRPVVRGVSIHAILATPDVFDDVDLVLTGVFSIGFEELMLFADRFSYEHGIYQNAITIPAKYMEQLKKTGPPAGTVVEVQGRFKTEATSGLALITVGALFEPSVIKVIKPRSGPPPLIKPR